MTAEEQAAADEAWLKLALRERYAGCDYDPVLGEFFVTLVRANGKSRWIFGDSPEAALAAARSHVTEERTTWQSRRK